jgi:hypothetical protein
MLRPFLVLVCLLAVLSIEGSSSAAGAGKSAPVAKCQSVRGVLLARDGTAPWSFVKPGDGVGANARLITLFEAELRSQNQAVDVKLFSDIGRHGPLPVMETALAIRANPKFDLDVAVERGIVVLSNAKKQGAARVRLHILGEDIDVSLEEPGSKLALEIYGRHAPGLASVKADSPATFVVFLNTMGRSVLSHHDKSIALKAPPGQALLRWDSIFKHPAVEFLDKLPDELKLSDAEKKVFARMCACVEHLQAKELAGHFEAMLKAKDEIDRAVAVTALGAIDDLPRLLGALANAEHVDVREQAVLVLRHWLGRDKGQVKALTTKLLERKKLSPTQALSLVQLLVGFDAREREQPQTYMLLIDYLKHSQLPVRHLAHWHLVRLAPEGKKITYDPAGSEAQRHKAIERWLELIPPGQVPLEFRSAPEEVLSRRD